MKERDEEKKEDVPNDEDNGEISPDEPTADTEGDEGLFEELMKKIEHADSLKDEIDSDLTVFSERVEDVVDSIGRIENIEKNTMEEKLLFREEERKVDPSTTKQINEVEPEVETESTKKAEYPLPTIGQLQIAGRSPYEEVSEGGIHPDEKAELITQYGGEVREILAKLKRLIDIKVEKDQFQEAKRLVNMALSMGGNDPNLVKDLLPSMTKLGIEPPVREGVPDLAGSEKKTNVLDPDMAQNVEMLEKKARSAIEQLNKQIEKSDLSQVEFNEIKDRYIKAAELFREKRFHKAHQTALKGLETIRTLAQDELDNKIQDAIFRAKGMIEELQKREKVPDPVLIDDLNKRMDKAMKAYLTNEYEKADLYSKRVIESIEDLGELDGRPTRERAKDLRNRLEKIKEKNILPEDVSELGGILKTAEELIRKKEGSSARKLLDRVEPSIEELEGSAEKYIKAREMEIRLSNKLEKLGKDEGDLKDANKKLSYMKDYLIDNRLDDALDIGEDLEKELDSVGRIRKGVEVGSVLEEIDDLMDHASEMDEEEEFKKRYREIVQRYEKEELEGLLDDANDLRSELKERYKTLGINRVRRISSGLIEIKILMTRLRSLNLDPTDTERRVRKIKNLFKEGSRGEGLKQMEDLIKRMSSTIDDHLERMRSLTTIHRDALEVIMDRHRQEPVIFHIRRKHVPVLRKMEDLGNFSSAIEGYRKLGSKFSGLKLPEDKKGDVETELTECKFEIYKRKEMGMDISEPLKLYTDAQKKYSSGDVVPAEYLVEISRRYCDQLLPINT